MPSNQKIGSTFSYSFVIWLLALECSIELFDILRTVFCLNEDFFQDCYVKILSHL